MTNIGIRTAQNTILKQNKASIAERLAAALFDLAVILSIMLLGFLILSVTKSKGSLQLLFFIPITFYTLISEITMQGQTIGKKILKIKVVHCEQGSVSFTAYLLRWLLRIVDIWIMFGSLGVISIVLSNKGQRIGDFAANTVVINLKKGQALLSKPYYSIKTEDETPRFTEVSMLEDADIEVIREVLKFAKENGYYGNAGNMVKQTSNTIRAKLSIDTSLNAGEFLVAILRDYYIIHRN